MLLIWDMHLSSKCKDKAFQEIRRVSELDDTLLFMGDYVHWFHYDRKLMWEFFDLLLEISRDKKIYVMSWNHDWIWDQFVFEEAQKAFSYMDYPRITFITEPTKLWNCFFLPFNIHFEWSSTNTNKGERHSENIIEYLEKQDLTWIEHFFFHHYLEWHDYWHGMNFFTKKDVSIPRTFIESNPNIHFWSWHVHEQSERKNYTCIWSILASSISEVEDKNVYNTDNKKFPINILSYIYFKDKLELVEWCNHKIAIAQSKERIELPDNRRDYYADVQIKSNVLIPTMWLNSVLDWMKDMKIVDWKEILKELIDKKYADKKEKFENILTTYWIL